jgi:hypothetical protein
MKPNFIIIGADKCGTTSAVFHLNQHPDIFVYNDKETENEVHFFDKDINYNKGIKWYETILNSKKKFIGEKTPSYFFLKYALDRIHNHYPDIKLIILLREPVSRSYSLYNNNLHDNETTQSYIDLIKQDELSIDPDIDQHSLVNSNFNNSLFNLQRGFYINYLEYIYSIFPKQNIHIAINEEIKQNPLEEYNKIYEFIGASKLKKKEFCFDTTINTRFYFSAINDNDFIYVHNIYKSYNNKLYELLGRKIDCWETFYSKKK